MTRRVEAAGLYLHVPFCRVHCPFCDFAITTAGGAGLRRRWEAAILREAAQRSPDWRLEFDSVYFGGGTPSLLGPEAVARTLAGLSESFSLAAGAEVTLEMNPGDLDAAALGALRRAGVDRLSLGVQSFDPADLRALGRPHSVEDSLASFAAARAAGFDNVSIDLIYALPRRDATHWRAQLARAIALAPEHLSAYVLSFEPGTPLERRRERGEIQPPAEEETRELFLLSGEILQAAGYERYEVSSFARGREWRSRHNRKYWEGGPYLGLGPAAHSFRDPRRSWNLRSLREWLEAIEGGRGPEAGGETLSPEQRRLERLFLGLRTAGGVDLAALAGDGGPDLRQTRRAQIERLEAEALAQLSGDRLRLTAAGLVIADAIARDLWDGGEGRASGRG